jgi:uncharacterized membrane protein YqjE
MDTSAPGSGLLGSLRSLTDSLLGSVQDRVQLLGVELQEEKQRLVQILVWLAAIVALGFLALIFASLVLVLAFWDTARLATVVGLALAYLTGLIVLVISFKRYLARQPTPFKATLSELRDDRACIRAET